MLLSHFFFLRAPLFIHQVFLASVLSWFVHAVAAAAAAASKDYVGSFAVMVPLPGYRDGVVSVAIDGKACRRCRPPL